MTPATSVKTICCYCGVGCGIEVSRDERGRMALRGDPDHPVNRGLLCSKGRTLLHVVESRADRLTQPMVRLDRTHAPRRSTWEAAITHVAREFQRLQRTYGDDAVGFYCSGQMLTEEYYLINKLTKGFLRTNNMDTNSRLCMSSAVAGYKQTLGADCVPGAYADVDHCDTFFVTGANPAWCHPILWRRVEARKQADANVRIILVDPRQSASCASADLHLQIIPGTDVALHLGLARQLHALGAVDEDFIAQHVDGWDALKNACAPYTLEHTAQVCGLRSADIAQAAVWLAGDRRFMSMWTMGLNQSSVGVDKNTSLINLSLITGKIGKPGCGPFSLTGQPNAMGGREVGGLSNLASNHRDLANPQHRKEISDHWGVASVPDKPGLSALEMFAALREGRMKAVWIVATNPIESLPDSWRAEEALKNADLVVVQDCYPTATSAMADVVLPAATWLEKSGTMTNSERRISLLSAAVPAPGEALPDTDIIKRFAAALGFEKSFTYADSAAIFAEHAALSRGRDCDISGLSHARLKEHGSVQWPAPAGSTGTQRLFADGLFLTANRRAQVKSPRFEHRGEQTSTAHPLILTTGRLRDQWHTMTKTGRVAKLRDHAPSPFVEINPDDAAARDIKQDSMVTITGVRGEVQVRAELTTSIRPGVVFLPMHWGKQLAGDKGRANNITSPVMDPISKEPDLKYAAVQVALFVPSAQRIVIIGGGAATHGFIQAHRAAGLNNNITVFGDEPQPLYDRVLLPHYISGDNRWSDLIKCTSEDLAAQGILFRPGIAIARIDRKRKEVIDARGLSHPYDQLILATGSRAAKLYQGPMPRSGVFFLRKRADAEAIRDEAGKGRRALIVGGGVLGIELADALHSLGTDITILQRSDRLMGKQLDARSAGMLADILTRRGIAIRFHAEIDELVGADQVSGARLKDGKILPCDFVVFATGTAPNAELARAAVLTCSTGVVVDEHLRTSDPHIFAIGEVADFKGVSAGTTAAAEKQAWHLVEYLRGNLHARYPGPMNANILKVHDVPCASIGVVDSDEPGTQTVTFDDAFNGIYQKCVIRNDRLIGVVMFGDISGFADYKELLMSGTELDERRHELLRGGKRTVVEGKLICSCNQVGDLTIARAVQAGACDLTAVCAGTRAGTACGSCRPEVQKLIHQQRASASPPLSSPPSPSPASSCLLPLGVPALV